MTQRFLHRSGREGIRLSGCFHAQRLMRAPVVVELDPVGDDPAGVLQTFEPMPMRALLLERPDHTFDHAVLLCESPRLL
jgi:hypothetical protein